MKFYRDLTYEQLVELWRREELKRRASRPTVLFHNDFTPAVTSFGWAVDAGSAPSATSLAASGEDGTYDVDVSSGDVQLYLFIQIEEQGDESTANNQGFQLRFDPAGGTTWQNVTAATSGIYGTADANTAATDEQAWTTGNFKLSGEEGTAYDGLEMTDDMTETVVAFDFQAANYTELVFAVTADSANLSDSQSITFNVAIGGTDITLDVTPTLTVTKSAGGSETSRTGDDGVFMPDFDERLHGRPRDDQIMFGGTALRLWLKVAADSLFITEDWTPFPALYGGTPALYGGLGQISIYGGAPPMAIITGADALVFGPDEDWRSHYRDFFDQIIFRDTRISEALFSLLDNILLGDTAQILKLWPRSAADGLLFSDQKFSDFLMENLDQILLSQAGSAVKIDTDTGDTALLVDALQAFLIKPVTDTDQILLVDERLSELDKIVSDFLLTDDATTKAREHKPSDQLLLTDAREFQIEKLFLNGLLLEDTRVSTVEKTIAEQILLADLLVKILEKIHQDNLLLGDDVDTTVTTPGIQEFTREVNDGLFLLSQNILIHEHLFGESVLFGDDDLRQTLHRLAEAFLFDETRVSTLLKQAENGLLLDSQVVLETLKTFLDSLLLTDQVAAFSGVAFSIADGLLLDDDRASDLRKIAADMLLVDSVRASELLKNVLDNLLLGDDVSADIITVVLRAVADGLFLRDRRTSLLEKIVQSGALLGDATEKLRELITTDDLLLLDTTTLFAIRSILQQDSILLSDTADLVRELVRSFQDNALFADFTEKTLGLTQSDRLLLFDSVSRQVVEAVLQALVWAALKAQDVMGVKTTWRPNTLGIEESQEDALSLQVGYVRNTDLRLVVVS